MTCGWTPPFHRPQVTNLIDVKTGDVRFTFATRGAVHCTAFAPHESGLFVLCDFFGQIYFLRCMSADQVGSGFRVDLA